MPDQPTGFERRGYRVTINPETHVAGSAVVAKWTFHIYRNGQIESVKRGVSGSKESAELAAREWIDEQREERRRPGAGDRRAGSDRRRPGNDRRVNKPDRRTQRRAYPDDRRLGDRRRMPIS
jgi:hypothetical protein